MAFDGAICMWLSGAPAFLGTRCSAVVVLVTIWCYVEVVGCIFASVLPLEAYGLDELLIEAYFDSELACLKKSMTFKRQKELKE